MSDTPPTDPERELPEWWKRLTPEEQASLRRILGENWQPSEKAEEDIARAFEETHRRIRDIERRALKKLRGGDDK
jgi:DNA-directed RNA polymerase sigma subunit (sigma70/sigma32)